MEKYNKKKMAEMGKACNELRSPRTDLNCGSLSTPMLHRELRVRRDANDVG